MSLFSNQRLINVANPINKNHILARDLAHWWMCLPGLMGGEYMHDLMASTRDPLTSASHAQRMTTTPGGDTYTNDPTWNLGTNRAGGFGHMVNPAFANPSGFMQCGDILNVGATYDFSLLGNINIIAHKDLSDCIVGQEAQTGVGIVLFIVPTTHQLRLNMSGTTLTGTTAILTEKWYQCVVTWTSAASSLASIYLNGSLEASGTGFSGRAIGNPAWQFIFSGNPNITSARPLSARFDDFRVYNRCLSAEEVKAIYFNSLAGYPDLLQRIGQISYASSALSSGPIKYRRTFSQFGTHSGGRQVIQ